MCRVNFTPNGQSKIEINGYRTSHQLEVSYFKKYVANIVLIYDIGDISVLKLITFLGAVQKLLV